MASFQHSSARRAALMLFIVLSAGAPHKSIAEGASPPGGWESPERPTVPVEERPGFELILTGIVQSHVATEERLPGQQALVMPKVWFNEKGDVLNVELGRAYLPTYYTMTFEERLISISEALINYMEKASPIYQVDLWFEGQDIFDYFPEERGPSDSSAIESASPSALVASSSGRRDMPLRGGAYGA